MNFAGSWEYIVILKTTWYTCSFLSASSISTNWKYNLDLGLPCKNWSEAFLHDTQNSESEHKRLSLLSYYENKQANIALCQS